MQRGWERRTFDHPPGQAGRHAGQRSRVQGAPRPLRRQLDARVEGAAAAGSHQVWHRQLGHSRLAALPVGKHGGPSNTVEATRSGDAQQALI